VRTLLVIGIGAGDPEYVTVQAVKALNRVDVFFVMDKGTDARDLTVIRREICERYIDDPAYRFVEVADPPRDRAAAAYEAAVEDWRRQRTDIYERLVRDELGEDGCGAFLVWGDPSVYDGTLQIVQDIEARGNVAFDYEVIPGISSVAALAARHRVALNRVGRPVQITTGRLLAQGFPDQVDDVVVMLDAGQAFEKVPPEGVEIVWGAYLGTPDELLVAGPLADVAGQIATVRAEAKARKGWIMDTYLLRRSPRSP
jgi:precorrin-6A synthase